MNDQTSLYHEDAVLIEALGGPAELARKLGYEERGAVQRVQNWKYRGIPELVRLKRADIFEGKPKRKRAA